MYLGIDFGTSGCRAVVIDAGKNIIAEARQPLPAPVEHNGRIEQDPALWLEALAALFADLSSKVDLSTLKKLATDGTSGTVLITDEQGRPLTPALMYNDSSSVEAVERIAQACPLDQHLTMTASSGLAKAIQLCAGLPQERVHILNQADFLSNHLANPWGISDYHNALKLGYDAEALQWPDWVISLLPVNSLPQVLEPGSEIGTIDSAKAKQFGLPETLVICSGSTDANAAFIATESTRPGDAVTSLGSTLVLKILNSHPVQSLQYGVYSHRIGNLWLAGGASNSGAKILRQYFTNQQLIDYSKQITLTESSGLDYYPLSSVGERFPVNDIDKQPNLSPRPESDILFLQGLLEGLSQIEKDGYNKLVELGAEKPLQIQTMGGGTVNPQWMAMRQQLLGVPVICAAQTEASYGSALLCLQGLEPYQR